MRLRIVSLALLVGTVCVGQQAQYHGPESIPPGYKCTSWTGDYCLATAEIKPRKCPKYEHVEHLRPSDGSGITTCAPDLHVVTEKEWQEIQQTMREWRQWKAQMKKLHEELQRDNPKQ